VAKEEVLPKTDIRVNATLVLIPVTVTDPLNRFVTGLEKENFKLSEDKVDQNITSFSSEDAPISVGVIFDCSGSMSNKMEKSRQAVAQFFKTANPEDEFFLVQFNNNAQLVQPFTHNLEEIQNRLTFTQAKGQTALLDAIYMGLHEMKKAQNPRKALLVISDGGDNNSRYSGGEVINLLREADVRVYALGLFDNARYLKKAAEDTGGAMVTVHNMNDLPDAIDKLSSQLRSQYLLGYYPVKAQNDGKFHKVKVLVSQAAGNLKLRTSWRHGYYAPY